MPRVKRGVVARQRHNPRDDRQVRYGGDVVRRGFGVGVVQRPQLRGQLFQIDLFASSRSLVLLGPFGHFRLRGSPRGACLQWDLESRALPGGRREQNWAHVPSAVRRTEWDD